MLNKAEDKISRSFKRDFPEAVPLVMALDLRVKADRGARVNGMPTYWLDGQYQLTGYKTAQGGAPFTKEMAAAHIQKVLKEIADGRAEVATESRDQRFARIIDGMRSIELRHRHFCSYRHPSGDNGTILFNGDPVTAWVRLWDEPGHVAHAEDVPIEQIYAVLNASFSNGGKTISGRKQSIGTQDTMGETA